ncbi:carotenoid biosynthesis protein [Actinomadura physcomitrii]|nr:carotenoid biosynthesis protein [Actinomadura physcomitrii]
MKRGRGGAESMVRLEDRTVREGARRRADGYAVAGAGFLASMVAAQVASGVGAEPVRWINPVVGALAAAAGCFAASRRGSARAAGAVATAMALGHTAERIGVRTGLPFGRYTYTPVLRPQVGGVPVTVAVAWSGMGLAAHAVAAVLVPGRRPVRRAAVGALALTAWDAFLDPQMLRHDLWRWARRGAYRGVPASNFAGWLGVSALLMAVTEAWVGGPDAPAGLVATYGLMAVMETLAFAVVFEPRDPVVAVAGGVAMGAFAVPAAVLTGRRRTS